MCSFGFVVTFVGGLIAGLTLTGGLTALVLITWLVGPRRRRLRAPAQPRRLACDDGLQRLLNLGYMVYAGHDYNGRGADRR